MFEKITKQKVRELKDKYLKDAKTAKELREWAGFFILMDKIHLLEWILGEREEP